MKEIGGKRIFYRYADCEIGQTLVEGEYIGDVIGKYGVQYEFEKDNGDVVVLGGGALKWKMERYANVGDILRIDFDGCIELEKGPFAGKNSNQFKVYMIEKAEMRNQPPLSDPATQRANEIATLEAAQEGEEISAEELM